MIDLNEEHRVDVLLKVSTARHLWPERMTDQDIAEQVREAIEATTQPRVLRLVQTVDVTRSVGRRPR